jgi:hypothetical protein
VIPYHEKKLKNEEKQISDKFFHSITPFEVGCSPSKQHPRTPKGSILGAEPWAFKWETPHS